METVFLVCAVVGGTVFVCQFVLALIGMGGEDFDLVDDIDIPDDVTSDIGDTQGTVIDHGSSWFFGIISFRTVVAAITFFGLFGMAASSGGVSSPVVVLLIALGGGWAAMYGVYWIMRLMYRLGQDGTVRIERSLGRKGTVYVPIPGGKSGAGKIQIRLQNRIMEYQAMTGVEDKLPTGARVEVVSIISPTTVEVEPFHETAHADDTVKVEKA